ncbi:hypothetical protein ZIOFF_028563 [Zingiber officinale]|uniref:Uncharacterized protein n=1 Tax=Zingiber officinale TaxID=94328 RepID=A0A8J5LF33_ZINOF|nr:hypothetical protein ZIOFF_028563 [Zingiber officinale]
MHAPSETHGGVVKRLLQYLNGTRDLGIRLLADTPFTLHDANMISWKSTKQRTVARSSTEAEYRVITSTATEIQWIKSLLTDLLLPVTTPTVLFTDNLGATYLSANPVFHSRMKSLAIDYHFVRDLVQASKL